MSFLRFTFQIGTALAAASLLAACSPAEQAASADSPAPAASEPGIILALGDSLTAGYGLADPADSYPSQLERKLAAEGYNYRVVNAGASGATTAGLLESLDWSLAEQPEIAIVVIGGNDMLRGLPVNQARENIRATLQQLRDAGVQKIVLGGMQATASLGPVYGREFAGMYPELAEEFGAELMPFFLQGVALDAQLNQADGIHPTGAGYEIIVENLWPYLEPLLEK